MKRAIIIEGADNLGKTTLARALQEQFYKEFRPVIIHCGPPPGDGKPALAYQLNYLHKTMKSMKEAEGCEIWDRSIIGECVYGPMYRSYDHAAYEEELVNMLQEQSTRIFCIVLYTDGEAYKRLGITSKGDETEPYQKVSAAPAISAKFVDVLSRLGLKNTIYINCANYATWTTRNAYIMKRVRAWLHHKPYEHLMTDDYTHTFFNAKQRIWKREKGFVPSREECGDYEEEVCALGIDHAKSCNFGKEHDEPTGACGVQHGAKYIFVGEAPGHDGCGKLGIPFYDDRSGNLMQTTLDRLGVHPTHYYMTNAVKCCPNGNKLGDYVNNDSRRRLECVMALKDELLYVQDRSPNAKVIALGKVASFELARLGLTHNVIYHPAYYLRMGVSDDFYRELKVVLEG